MAQTFIQTLGVAALALATGASATTSYALSETYDSTNFFSKFAFFTGTDPTSGFVQYLSEADAETAGLISTADGEVYIGPDFKNTYSASGEGRKSVRLQSTETYTDGLVIADFSHLPQPVCGSWPSFWMYGSPWPTKGEIDIYENWNDLTYNRNTAHVAAPADVGTCTISASNMKASLVTPNCYDYAAGQANNQGCSADDSTGPFGSSSGGVYAMEWNSDHIKIWNWAAGAVPSDVTSGAPVPSGWGEAAFAIEQSSCDIDKAFMEMMLVLDIDFCGTAGQSGIWDTCATSTGSTTCAAYVAANPAAYKDTYFQIKSIKIYTESTVAATSSTTSSTSIDPPATSTSSAVTSASASATGASSQKMTTSTVQTTTVRTTTSNGNVATVTDTVDLYTTVCPVEESETASATTAKMTTSTVQTTTVRTTTSNGNVATVTDTVDLYTTVCPVEESETASPTTTKMTTSVVQTTSVYTTSHPVSGVQIVTATIDLYTTVCPVEESETATATTSPAQQTETVVPVEATTSSVQAVTTTSMTTSVVQTTSVYTTTHPVSGVQIVTATIDLYTTVCPVEEAKTATATGTVVPVGGNTSPAQAATSMTTSTVQTTSVYTTTHPVSGEQIVTATIDLYTTVCPVEEAKTAIPTGTKHTTTTTVMTTTVYATRSTSVSVPAVVAVESSSVVPVEATTSSAPVVVPASSSAVPVAVVTASVAPVAPSYNATLASSVAVPQGTGSSATAGSSSSTTPVFVSGAMRTGVTSAALMAVAGFFVFAM